MKFFALSAAFSLLTIQTSRSNAEASSPISSPTYFNDSPVASPFVSPISPVYSPVYSPGEYAKGKGVDSKGAYSKGKGGYTKDFKGAYSKGKRENSKGKRMNSKGNDSKGKGGDVSQKGANGKGHYYQCTSTVFEISQFWGEPLIEPNGTIVEDASMASDDRGQKWAFVDDVLDKDGSRKVGLSAELRTRLNKGDKWQSKGTLMDLYGCAGYLAFEGPFSDFTLSGMYTITGGTGDFTGAKGYITETFHYESRYGIRRIVIE